MKSRWRVVDSPLSPLWLRADAKGRLTDLRIGDDDTGPGPQCLGDVDIGLDAGRALDVAAAQLAEYFARQRQTFDIPLAMEGSPFQRQVWAELLQIPFGTTASYGDVAAHMGRTGAARAVGHANARNPIAIIVPCHRVIGSSGGLTGYGGGLRAKRYLLDLEAQVPRRSS
ncbi:MAG TPA: methylated-DNA--[protein]-cysteine S-methyltransferase [Acidimicrobiales bacterium]|nr:methylated-DNA--[protein]-cysteine S-methyltransferase [Acidimicrobiales bacterium]